MAMSDAVLRLRFLDANPKVQVVGTKAEAARVNYFTGNDPEKRRTNIPTYGEIIYRDLYPGGVLALGGGLQDGPWLALSGAEGSKGRISPFVVQNRDSSLPAVAQNDRTSQDSRNVRQ